ncbi:MAG: hypoxanthine phosphoribosyltransferase [Lachnospirales bacterium]
MTEYIDVLISNEDLHKRIKEVAEEINRDYAGKEIVLIGALKGAVMFMVDLSKELTCDVKFDFIDVSSYHGSTESSGNVVLNKDIEHDITDAHVLLVEDIVDTGHSLVAIRNTLEKKNPASLKVCALLNKQERREVENLVVDYLGFEIPNKFVVGYGLDYDQRLRNLDYIGIMRFKD